MWTVANAGEASIARGDGKARYMAELTHVYEVWSD